MPLHADRPDQPRQLHLHRTADRKLGVRAVRLRRGRALALLVDRLLALAESAIALRSAFRLGLAALGLAVVLLASLLPGLAKAPASLTIGAKNFEEQYTLSALIDQRLERAGLRATVKSDLGSAIAFHALAAGDIDLYVDYSGTIWADQMHRADMPGRAALLAQMSAWMKHTAGITMLGPLGFENAYAFAMRRDPARPCTSTAWPIWRPMPGR